MNLPGEIWRPIPGLPYEASSKGRIRRSIKAPPACGSRPGHILKQQDNQAGYFKVWCSKNGKARNYRVSRLVAMAFHRLPAEGEQASHEDGNPKNNTPANLRWRTASENNLMQRLHGTSRRGSKQNGAKLTELEVARIRERFASGGISKNQLARDHGVSPRMIRNILLFRKWRHVESTQADEILRQANEAARCD